MSQKSILRVVVLACILTLFPLIMLSADGESKICIVKFNHDFAGLGSMGVYQMSGEAEIDYGIAKRETIKYVSVTKLLLDMASKGYELKTAYCADIPRGNSFYTFFIFYKNQ